MKSRIGRAFLLAFSLTWLLSAPVSEASPQSRPATGLEDLAAGKTVTASSFQSDDKFSRSRGGWGRRDSLVR